MKKLLLLIVLSTFVFGGCVSGTKEPPAEPSPESEINQPAETPEPASTQKIAEDQLVPDTNAAAEYKNISPEDAHTRLAEAEDIIVLDVRTEEEYAEAHIPGAVLLPDSEVAEKIETVVPDKDAEIFVYCRSGRRSKNAADIMTGMGYTNVYDLGGIQDWPYETVSE